MEKKSYEQAVEYYTKASGVLNQYKNMDSFKAINDECVSIMQGLKGELAKQLDSKDLSQREMVKIFELLKRLSDSPAQVQCHLLSKTVIHAFLCLYICLFPISFMRSLPPTHTLSFYLICDPAPKMYEGLLNRAQQQWMYDRQEQTRRFSQGIGAGGWGVGWGGGYDLFATVESSLSF